MTAKAKPPASSRKDSAAAGNLRFWNAVCETDPANTSKVNQRGGFTAICAHSQRMEATKLWGPEGEHWEVDATPSQIEVGNVTLAIVDLQLKWREKASDEWRKCQAQRGSAVLESKGRVDTDAWKKAGTDALTKSLAGMGFNADVFLGKFDDNKYVSEMRKKHAPKADAEASAAEIRDIALIKPLRDSLVALDSDQYRGKPDSEIAAQFRQRAEAAGRDFDKSFIDDQIEAAQTALMRKAST